MGACAPWVTIAEGEDADPFLSCDAAAFEEGVLAASIDVATDLLWRLSGKQYPGLCTDVIRPCGGVTPGQLLEWPENVPGGSRPIGSRSCSCDVLACSCAPRGMYRLPRTPVRDVLEVLVNGQVVEDVELVDRHSIIGPIHWPCCQRLDLPPTEAGTWQVTYTHGQEPPPSGRMAAGVLACEIAKALAGDDTCQLPKRVQQFTREGLTVLLDNFEMLDAGRTGIYQVDLFLKATNPAGARRQGRFLSPATWGRRAHRKQ